MKEFINNELGTKGKKLLIAYFIILAMFALATQARAQTYTETTNWSSSYGVSDLFRTEYIEQTYYNNLKPLRAQFTLDVPSSTFQCSTGYGNYVYNITSEMVEKDGVTSFNAKLDGISYRVHFDNQEIIITNEGIHKDEKIVFVQSYKK